MDIWCFVRFEDLSIEFKIDVSFVKNGITSGPVVPDPIVLVVNMAAISLGVPDINRYAKRDCKKYTFIDNRAVYYGSDV